MNELYKTPTLEESPLSLLLYGQSGVGKTRFAAQLPAPVLFLSCDTGVLGGLTSALQFKPLQIRISTFQQLQQILPIVEKDAGQVFRTIVVDSLTSLQRIVMASILQVTGREIARFEDWNLCVERIRNIVNKVGSFNCNVVFTCTEQLVKDEVLGKVMILPNLPGRLAQELPAAVDIVLYLFTRTGYNSQGKKEVKYVAMSTPDEMRVAKDRTCMLPKEGEHEEFLTVLNKHNKEEK